MVYMSDYIVLIHSNGHGNPKPGGRIGHWVRYTSRTNPTPVNQLAAGGRFPHADCGEACVASYLDDVGKHASVVTVEHDADAPYWGTSAAQLQQALADFGIASTYVTALPWSSANVVMNPLGGRVITNDREAYDRAFYGQAIALASMPTPPPPTPAPKPVIIEDEDMPYLATSTRAAGVTPDPRGAGAVYVISGLEKRWLSGLEGAAIPQLVKLFGPIKDFSDAPFTLDHVFEEGDPIDATYWHLPLGTPISLPDTTL